MAPRRAADGESALASPVFDASGAAVGAIAVVISSGGDLTPEAARDPVREAARAISRELGADVWPPRSG
jgi:DNA-binding IclR family transcriptional regulator